jgi:hypothetical protein
LQFQKESVEEKKGGVTKNGRNKRRVKSIKKIGKRGSSKRKNDGSADKPRF